MSDPYVLEICQLNAKIAQLEAEVASHERYRELVRSNLAESEWKKENERLQADGKLITKLFEEANDLIEQALDLMPEYTPKAGPWFAKVREYRLKRDDKTMANFLRRKK